MDHEREAVRFDGVDKSYGPVHALTRASFAIGRGETVALLGPNGAGKSTAVGIMLGLLRPDGGRVEVLGGPPEVAVAAGRVGAMLQVGGLPEGGRVAEVVDLVRQFYPRPLPLENLLTRAGLNDIAGRRVDGLSGGQAQRVRFALAMAGDSDVVFLDEPTEGMDVETRRGFWVQIRVNAALGHTVLFATHRLEEAETVADRVVVLSHGAVVADAPVATLKASTGLRTIRLTHPAPTDDDFRSLPGVQGVDIHGTAVTLQTTNPETTLAAAFRAEIPMHDLEVAGANLEEAFIALTEGEQT
jgi:ABC-2 type transport system ATP-binding protein